MKFIDLVKKRRSCRKYLTKSISKESIERCMEAARLAPSACNSQPWSFIVVQNKALKETVAKGAFSGIHSVYSFVKDAPVLIVAVREKSRYLARLGGQLRGAQFNLIDLGIACEHIVLAAEEVGLGSCWIGWFNERKVKKALNIPRQKKVDIIISLGYKAEELSEVTNRRSLNEICDFR